MSASEDQELFRKQMNQLMDGCIQDAKMLAIKNGINQEEVVATIAAALFERRVLLTKE